MPEIGTPRAPRIAGLQSENMVGLLGRAAQNPWILWLAAGALISMYVGSEITQLLSEADGGGDGEETANDDKERIYTEREIQARNRGFNDGYFGNPNESDEEGPGVRDDYNEAYERGRSQKAADQAETEALISKKRGSD